MPTQNAEAVVLRQYTLGEADRIVVFFTREFGKLRAVARGARKLKSRFGGDLVFWGGKKLITIPRAGHNDIMLVGMEMVWHETGTLTIQGGTQIRWNKTEDTGAGGGLCSYSSHTVTISGPDTRFEGNASMLGGAIMMEISIVMIILSRVLKYKVNRWTNITTSIITIVFVVGGGVSYPHYIFVATVEVICLLSIIWFACKWRNPEG
jgi:hypothetical protein